MRVLVQRSKKSSVKVDNKVVGQISKGIVLFVGFTAGDSEENIDYMIQKILKLRIFDDDNNVMNRNILELTARFYQFHNLRYTLIIKKEIDQVT